MIGHRDRIAKRTFISLSLFLSRLKEKKFFWNDSQRWIERRKNGAINKEGLHINPAPVASSQFVY